MKVIDTIENIMDSKTTLKDIKGKIKKMREVRGVEAGTEKLRHFYLSRSGGVVGTFPVG